jgi:Zn-dependent protease with chaperone function
LKNKSYSRAFEKKYRTFVSMTALLVLSPLFLIAVRGNYLLTSLSKSKLFLHLCHFLQTTLPSLLNIFLLITILLTVAMIPAGLFRVIIKFFKGITYPTNFASLVPGGEEPLEVSDATFQSFSLYRVKSSVPFAFAAGITGKRIYFSTGMESLLSPYEMKAALLHEAGHLVMNHPAKRLFTRSILEGLFMLPFRKEMWKSIKDLSEFAADEYAVTNGADPRALASAMVKVAKGFNSAEMAAAPGFSDYLVSRRVRALLGEKERGSNGGGNRIPLVKCASLLLFLLLLLFPYMYRMDVNSCARSMDRTEISVMQGSFLSLCLQTDCSKCVKCIN